MVPKEFPTLNEVAGPKKLKNCLAANNNFDYYIKETIFFKQ
jgi:hypothetical protein